MKYLLLLMFAAPLLCMAQPSTELGWEDLIPQGMDFGDPFQALTEEQLIALGGGMHSYPSASEKPDCIQ